jgi:hypothetical protein
MLASGYAYFAAKEPKKRRFALVFLALIGVLSLGYGENSWLKLLCRGSETLTRLAMACLISLIFCTYGFFVGSPIWTIPSILLLNLIAWEIRAGSAGKALGKDILIEDICRATAFSISLIFLLR